MVTEAQNRYAEMVAEAREAAAVLSEEDRDLRPIAFRSVLDHLLGNGNGVASSEATKPKREEEPIDSSLATEELRVASAARYFHIEPAQVREIFDLRGEEPELVVHSSKLASKKAEAVREIALLIGGIRTATALETGTSHIRDAAKAYNKFDGNFMKILGEMDRIAVLGKPQSPNRLVRMRVIGAEAARPLAQRLVA